MLLKWLSMLFSNALKFPQIYYAPTMLRHVPLYSKHRHIIELCFGLLDRVSNQKINFYKSISRGMLIEIPHC